MLGKCCSDRARRTAPPRNTTAVSAPTAVIDQARGPGQAEILRLDQSAVNTAISTSPPMTPVTAGRGGGSSVEREAASGVIHHVNPACLVRAARGDSSNRDR